MWTRTCSRSFTTTHCISQPGISHGFAAEKSIVRPRGSAIDNQLLDHLELRQCALAAVVASVLAPLVAHLASQVARVDELQGNPLREGDLRACCGDVMHGRCLQGVVSAGSGK